MTEDEAFIRTLVDSPGDDTSRLAYADWLDEQGDPRGQYLRAEHDWSRTPGTEATPHKTAAALDPLWVARVSRPPVGVCCDHVRFVNCGPRLASDEIALAEEVLGCLFPTTYRAFLLNYNAGGVEPHDVPENVENTYAYCEEAAVFYSIGRSFDPECGVGRADLVEIVEYLRSEEMRRHGDPDFPIDHFIPLATPMWHLDIVFLGVGREECGRVYHLANLQDYGLDADNLTEVAASLPEFLAKLKPTWSDE